MSGTSLDALDLALILTDGHRVVERGPWSDVAFPKSLAESLRGLMHGEGDALRLEQEYTLFVAGCVDMFLKQHPAFEKTVSIIGFHGQTITHRPLEGITWQLGNPSLLAERTGIPVAADFRRRDMAAGGQGAPLVPLYHAALSADLPKPLTIVNIGGVANVTYVGESEDALLAWDTGPGNALLNDWISFHTGETYDADGRYARAGYAHASILAGYMKDTYLSAIPPKSLDRNHFSLDTVRELSLQDGAATLTAFTVEAIARAGDFFPQPPTRWLIAGGGRHNAAIMQSLAARLGQPVINADDLGWRGDAIEAEAFAYLAVRSMRGLPISLPGTTGVRVPTSGGGLYT